MTTEIQKKLESELEATRRTLAYQVSQLQQDLAKLATMVNGPAEAFDGYQYGVWTQGNAASKVTEIASLLARKQALQEALVLLDKEKPSSDL